MSIGGRVKPRDTNLGSLVAQCAHLAAHPEFGPIVVALQALAREQDDFNKDSWAEHQGEPADHARRHKGGADSVISTSVPEADSLTGSAGSPRDGATAHGHRHPSTLTTRGDLLTVADGALARLPGPRSGQVLTGGVSASSLRWNSLDGGLGPLGGALGGALGGRRGWVNVFAHQNFK